MFFRRRIALVLPLLACGVQLPDPAPICAHLESLAKKEQFDWDATRTAKCIDTLQNAPQKDLERSAKQLECLGTAPDLASARKCANWVFFI